MRQLSFPCSSPVTLDSPLNRALGTSLVLTKSFVALPAASPRASLPRRLAAMVNVQPLAALRARTDYGDFI